MPHSIVLRALVPVEPDAAQRNSSRYDPICCFLSRNTHFQQPQSALISLSVYRKRSVAAIAPQQTALAVTGDLLQAGNATVTSDSMCAVSLQTAQLASRT